MILEEGRIRAIGTHEELISREGLYQRIYEIQSRRKGGAHDDEV